MPEKSKKEVDGVTDIHLLEKKIAEMHNSFNIACETIEAAVEQFSKEHSLPTSSDNTLQQLNNKIEEIKKLKRRELRRQQFIQDASKQMAMKFESALAKLHKMSEEY